MPDNSAPPVDDPQVQPSFHRRSGRSCGNWSSRTSWATFLILFGILLFLSNIGLFPIHNIWTYWPLYLVILGVSKLIGGRPQEGTAGVILTAVGSILFASNRGWVHFNHHDWMSVSGLILVVVGILGLQAAGRGGPAMWARRRGRPHPHMYAGNFGQWPAYQPPPTTSGQANEQPNAQPESQGDEWLRDSAVFGGIKRRIETNQFTGGHIESVFGSLELDMRNIAMPPAQSVATLHVNCVFGAIKIRIPQHWRVSLQVAGAFGAAEDKTVPMPRTDLPPSTLVITGSSAFGAVEIEN